ncbi:hypothetical protein COB55_04375 [Candidatus Wolfebacteria bacterium]|nr:MAG: hypothetical protein COB55_04375 [Candidatus Wolfebacteria bacterium]
MFKNLFKTEKTIDESVVNIIEQEEVIPEVPKLTWNELLDKHDELSVMTEGIKDKTGDSYIEKLKRNGATQLSESIKRRKFYSENNSKIISPESLKKIIDEHKLVMGRIQDANFYIPEDVLDNLEKFPIDNFEEYDVCRMGNSIGLSYI